jgi:hypothetical protein
LGAEAAVEGFEGGEGGLLGAADAHCDEAGGHGVQVGAAGEFDGGDNALGRAGGLAGVRAFASQLD